jgi:DNA replication and repair protein RecF
LLGQWPRLLPFLFFLPAQNPTFAAGKTKTTLHLQQLILTNFRNYTYQILEFSPGLNLVTGLNGMGKTNLLDAIYYLCMGKSYLTANDRQVVRQDEPYFRLEGQFLKGNQREKFVAKVIPGKEKTLEHSAIAYDKIADHVGALPVVFLAPDDTSLAMDGSEERRRFLDNTLCQLDRVYLENLVRYNRVLSNRNALLKQFSEKNDFNPTLLEAYNQQLLEPAALVLAKRTAFVQEFQPVFNLFYQTICSGVESVDCQYKSQLLHQDFASLLEINVERDRILQRTTTGIHKDDLEFELDGKLLKRFASQGQLKSFVLAMKLAQFECLRQHKQEIPLLLLDDLFDKLDDLRIASLIKLLSGSEFGQLFISDAHPERADAIAKHYQGDSRRIVIDHGEVSFEIV